MSVANQLWLEEQHSSRYAKKLVMSGIKESPELVVQMELAVTLLNQWINSDSPHPSVKKLKDALATTDLDQVVETVLLTITMEVETSLTNLVMKLVHITPLEKRQAIQLAAEVVAICSKTALFDIEKGTEVWMAYSNVQIPLEVQEHLAQTSYLPPLIIKPKKIKSNKDTAYRSYNSESQILGHTSNYHEDDISLDVINIQNKVALRLDMDFMSVYQEETPDFELDDDGNKRTLIEATKAKVQWYRYTKQASYFSHLLSGFGNKFYLATKVDKRGRLYCAGYHISYQGSSYRKAVLELHQEEFIHVD